VAAPRGYDDGPPRYPDEDDWGSWNGGGTTGSPGGYGPTCYDPEGEFDFCYVSCGACTDTCWWTTCEDSVAQVGVGVTGGGGGDGGICTEEASVFKGMVHGAGWGTRCEDRVAQV
jgi:hypothetical protein